MISGPDLMRAHRALCSAFVDETLFRDALGGGRADLGTVSRYLQIPVSGRPILSVFFDPHFYRAMNPEITEAGLDPLLHFIETGIANLRAPHPLLDLRFIANEDPHALGAPPTIDALMEVLAYDLADPSPYMDLAHYVAAIGGVAPAGGLLRHYLTTGLEAGTRPNAFLAPRWYADAYADVPDDPYGAIRHFIVMGDAEARRASPEFDGAQYRARYTDVADANAPPLRHYLTNGRREGRQAAMDRAAPNVARSSHDAIEPLHYDEMRALLAATRQRLKDAVVPRAPAMFQADDVAAEIANLRFPSSDSPRLSILVPVYDEADYTAECLMALQTNPPSASFEIVIADDCSTDPAIAALGRVENLVVIRQAENRGFIRNCNDSFARCRGEYVLLLNNDTQVQPYAIDRLIAALDADPAVAAVGPKLLYPTGRLQEAGCTLRADGQSAMIGLFADPAEAGYCHDRDVDYCSGAALMFRRGLAGGTLFDEAYRPAYCEDADLCLRFLAAGHRVRYIHQAIVVHHLSVSTNRQSVTRKSRTIVRNQQTLSERWGPLLSRLDRVRPIAFYLPQFHPTPENDLWWGRGFTEWTNVARARPSFSGHYQPHLPADLGFYDLRTRETLAQQAALAARYGIEGFCVYYYNFGGRRVLSRPLEVVRASPEIPFRHCLCWANENWTKHWDGGTREILLEQSYDAETLASIIADVAAHASDPRYIRVDGKPLFLVYRPLKLPDPVSFARDCRAAFAEAGLNGVHMVYVESMEAVDQGLRPADIGFDASVEFPPHGRAKPSAMPAEIVKPGWSGYRYDYASTVMAFIERKSVPYPRYPAVFPSWDNTPRQPLKGTSFDGCAPDLFRFYVEEKIEEARQFLHGEHRLLFVNAWNEWAEGAHLEPDSQYGHGWLEALRDAVEAKKFA